MEKFENCGAVKEEIDKLEENIPDKDSDDYLEWKNKFNKLVEIYNFMCKFEAYKRIS